MNESEMGINGLMNRLMLKLKECDPQVWNRLKGQELEPQFYSFRYSIKVISFIKFMVILIEYLLGNQQQINQNPKLKK